ncbi:hypothetical protein ACLOJK_011278 [Asimina triloba]
MLEAVDHEYMEEFFGCYESILTEDGLLVLQGTPPEHQTRCSITLTKAGSHGCRRRAPARCADARSNPPKMMRMTPTVGDADRLIEAIQNVGSKPISIAVRCELAARSSASTASSGDSHRPPDALASPSNTDAAAARPATSTTTIRQSSRSTSDGSMPASPRRPIQRPPTTRTISAVRPASTHHDQPCQQATPTQTRSNIHGDQSAITWQHTFVASAPSSLLHTNDPAQAYPTISPCDAISIPPTSSRTSAATH